MSDGEMREITDLYYLDFTPEWTEDRRQPGSSSYRGLRQFVARRLGIGPSDNDWLNELCLIVDTRIYNPSEIETDKPWTCLVVYAPQEGNRIVFAKGGRTVRKSR